MKFPALVYRMGPRGLPVPQIWWEPSASVEELKPRPFLKAYELTPEDQKLTFDAMMAKYPAPPIEPQGEKINLHMEEEAV